MLTNKTLRNMLPHEALAFLLLSQAFTLTPIVGPQLPIDGQSTLQEDLTETELKDWMDRIGHDIRVIGLPTSRLAEVVKDPYTVWEIDRQEVDNTVSVAKATDVNGTLKVYNNEMEESDKRRNGIPLTSSAATNYLPYVENGATVIHLNHIARGNWFATDKLGGCDVWIVKPDGFVEPLVIHANANNYRYDPAGGLQFKEDLVKKVLDYFTNHNNISGYHFVYRISPSFEHIKNKRNKTKLSKYWKNVKHKCCKYPTAKTPQYTLFYGTVSGTLEEEWEFVLKLGMSLKREKPEILNKILLKITCPLMANRDCVVRRMSNYTCMCN